MNYKLAKKLKDAGFPQDFGWGGWICKHGADYDPNRKNYCKCYGDDLIRRPTLSELIEACRNNLWNLEWDGGKWHANFKQGSEYDYGETDGKTPEIAVAKLYIKLNENR